MYVYLNFWYTNNNLEICVPHMPTLNLSRKQLLDVLLDLERRSCGRVSLDNFALFINQEFLKVPFDDITKETTSIGFQELVDWSCAWSIHINLVEYRELCFEPGASKLLDLRV